MLTSSPTARVVAVMLLASMLPKFAFASEPYVPPELEPWRQWVLHGHAEVDCPLVNGVRQRSFCTFPDRLAISVDAEGAAFELTVSVFGESTIVLPGAATTWPRNVRANEHAIPVLDRGTAPVVELEPGRHVITGSIPWARLPESLTVPPRIGLLTLEVDGRRIPQPVVSQGRLWLGARAVDTTARNTLAVAVYRRLIDDIPQQLVTYLRLTVGGASRIETLGRVVLDGFEPVGLASDLPARLEDDGSLRARVEPGVWLITVRARATAQIETFAMDANTEAWPDQEVWGFDARRDLRVVQVTGVRGVNLRETGAPFNDVPGYLVLPDQPLTLVEQQRGDLNPAPDEYALTRQLWLDFDGDGYIVHDRLAATTHRTTRLWANYLPGRISVDGKPVVITTLAGAEPGIELGIGSYQVDAISALPADLALTAVGWRLNAQSLQGTLNLPPGWRLLWATGVDQVAQAWVSKWSLWDVFLVVLTLVLAYRVLPPLWAVALGVTLVLSYQEPGSPVFGWLLLAGLLAIRRATHHAVATRWLRAGYWLVLTPVAFAAMTFAVQQARQAVHPQLESRAGIVASYQPDSRLSGNARRNEVVRKLGSVPEFAPPSDQPARAIEQFQEIVVEGRRPAQQQSAARVMDRQLDRQVQTGPGRPAWKWTEATLSWSGPVDADQALSFVLLPPWVVRIMSAAIAVLVLVLVAGFALVERKADAKLPGWLARIAPAGLPVLLLVSLVTPLDAAAQVPDPEILKRLEARLTATPECVPHCASLEHALIVLDEKRLSGELIVHAAAFVAVPIPSAGQVWSPTEVSLDGQAAALSRDAHGTLLAALPAGIHRIRFSGPVDHLRRLELAFPLRPGSVAVRSSGWRDFGLMDGVLVAGSLRLERMEQQQTQQETLIPEVAAPYVEVYRDLAFGLDWLATTRLTRIAPEFGAITAQIPLLPGESVLDDRIEVKDGIATVVLGPDESGRTWQSSLSRSATLVLTAPDVAERREVWSYRSSNYWHVEHSGVAPAKPTITTTKTGGPVFYPRSNETLTIELSRPVPIPGESVTVEAVRLVVTPGQRTRSVDLYLTLLASQGGEYAITTPPDAIVRRIQVDGREQPIPRVANQISLPVLPGEHRYEVGWSESQPITTRFKTPVVTLATPANNISIESSLPSNRWPIVLGGPRLGAAMLFWGVVLVVALVGFGLSRLERFPLTGTDAVLLGFGMSICNLPSMILVAAWLLILWWRQRAHLETLDRR
ncbi:MAG: hypothetical protein O7H39_05305, partial [Gammaproteobacteria bacterium]|nr:hypothetical protein [Gammaproteobacteria bacterium]